jgi:hypothetical protein
MSVLTEWFEGRTVPHEEDETGKRFYQFRIGALLALLLVILAGCASTGPRSEVCIMQMLGRTESGVPVVAMQCVTPEEFEESQK